MAQLRREFQRKERDSSISYSLVAALASVSSQDQVSYRGPSRPCISGLEIQYFALSHDSIRPNGVTGGVRGAEQRHSAAVELKLNFSNNVMAGICV